MHIVNRVLVVALGALCAASMAACSSDDGSSPTLPPSASGGDGTSGGGGGDGGGDGGTNLQGNTVVDLDQINPDANACDPVIKVVFRDFTSAHPDFERDDLGWGPNLGVVEKTLGPDKKPKLVAIRGEFQAQDPSCGETCPNGGDLANSQLVPTTGWTNIPMFESAETFAQWYTDIPGTNMRVEKALVLNDLGNGTYEFVDPTFFPLDGQGFGNEPGQLDEAGQPHNFLFTTEVHVQFTYNGGEVFTFSGDDDLWIFVNNRLALDLGGLHWPFRGTIDFDAQAADLGISPGNTYDMDIFHAERHTKASNFRIETNISCFINVIIE